MRVRDVMQAEDRVHARPHPHQVLALVDGPLGERQPERGHGRNTLGQRECHIGQLGARHDPVHHAQLVGPVRVEAVAGEQRLLGEAGPQHPRMSEVLHARYPHPDDGVGEEGVLRGDDQVAHPGQHEAAGDARTLHHRDGGLRHLPPAPAHAEVDLHLAGVTGVGPRLAHVVPPQHRLAVERGVHVPADRADVVAGQHDYRDLLGIHGAGERRVQGVGHGRVLCVAVPRPVQGHQGHGAALLVAHRLVARPLVARALPVRGPLTCGLPAGAGLAGHPIPPSATA